MLIWLADLELVEYPDELGALVLADPTQGDVPDFSLAEVNLLVNGVLGLLFDETMSLEQNISHAKQQCTMWGTPDAIILQKASLLIKQYNEAIPEAEIGYGDRDMVLDAYGFQRPLKAAGVIIDQPMHEIGKAAELGYVANPVLAGEQ